MPMSFAELEAKVRALEELTIFCRCRRDERPDLEGHLVSSQRRQDERGGRTASSICGRPDPQDGL